jgi:hypothetical protein
MIRVNRGYVSRRWSSLVVRNLLIESRSNIYFGGMKAGLFITSSRIDSLTCQAIGEPSSCLTSADATDPQRCLYSIRRNKVVLISMDILFARVIGNSKLAAKLRYTWNCRQRVKKQIKGFVGPNFLISIIK